MNIMLHLPVTCGFLETRTDTHAKVTAAWSMPSRLIK
jgi:hypothetical protein